MKYYICFGNNTALNTVAHTYWNTSFSRQARETRPGMYIISYD